MLISRNSNTLTPPVKLNELPHVMPMPPIMYGTNHSTSLTTIDRFSGASAGASLQTQLSRGQTISVQESNPLQDGIWNSAKLSFPRTRQRGGDATELSPTMATPPSCHASMQSVKEASQTDNTTPNTRLIFAEDSMECCGLGAGKGYSSVTMGINFGRR